MISIAALDLLALHVCNCSFSHLLTQHHVACALQIVDRLKAEREQGMTVNVSLWKCETAQFACTLIDAPGEFDSEQGQVNYRCVRPFFCIVTNLPDASCEGLHFRRQSQ